MPNQRDAVTMSESEVRASLDEPRSMILATHGGDGAIHQVAMWFGFHQGRLAMTSYRRSQKVVNLRRDPRFSGLLEAGDTYLELRGVNLSGTVELVDDPEQVLAVVREVGARYARPDEPPVDAEKAAAGRVAMLFDVERTASWDHRKLSGRSY